MNGPKVSLAPCLVAARSPGGLLETPPRWHATISMSHDKFLGLSPLSNNKVLTPILLAEILVMAHLNCLDGWTLLLERRSVVVTHWKNRWIWPISECNLMIKDSRKQAPRRKPLLCGNVEGADLKKQQPKHNPYWPEGRNWWEATCATSGRAGKVRNLLTVCLTKAPVYDWNHYGVSTKTFMNICSPHNPSQGFSKNMCHTHGWPQQKQQIFTWWNNKYIWLITFAILECMVTSLIYPVRIEFIYQNFPKNLNFKENIIYGHDTWFTAETCKIQESLDQWSRPTLALIPMLIYSDQCWSISINSDQCQVKQNWSGMDRQWSALRAISDQCHDFDRDWSGLIGINWHWALIKGVLKILLTL